MAVLSDALDVRKSQVELVLRRNRSHKQFLVRGVTVDELRQRIDAALKK